LRGLKLVIVAALGLGLALYLLVYVGFGAVVSAAASVGWGGFAVLCLCALAMCPLLAAPWYGLLPAGSASAFRIFVWARMVREAATDVLPFSQLGGLVLGARAAILHGVPAPMAFASTIVDVTTELLAQVGYIALGFAILSMHVPRTPLATSLSRFFALGFALALVAGAVFLALQRYGHRFANRLAARLLPRAVAQAAAVGVALDAIYASRARVALSAAIHFSAWIASAAVTWLAFRLIGVRIDFLSVIAIESLVATVKGAAVLVPNGLGVQEGTYMLLAPLFGFGPQFGLAISLLKRARDIAVGVPILLVSQTVEGRRLLSGGAGADLTDSE
jgi:putative membrane protein